MVVASPDYMAPSFAVFVEDTELREDVTKHIVSVEYEHSTNLANVLTVTLENTDHRFTDSIMWSPGNEVELHLGYGPDVGFVGRGEIIRHLPNFPNDAAPRLQIKAYDRSWRMMQQELQITGGVSKRPKKRKKKEESGRKFEGRIGTVITELAEKYGMTPDIDTELGNIERTFIQPKGTNDYKVLRALANLYNADFRVEWDPTFRVWTVKFLKIGKATQDDVYTFRYAEGDEGTILSCDLEFGMPQSPSELQAWVFDRGQKDWLQVALEEEDKGSPEEFSPGTFVPGGEQAGPIESMTKFRLGIAGHSVEVMTRKFPDPNTALEFLKQWFQRRKDSFITANVNLIGVDTLRAGQTHTFEGLGERYSGDYFLTTVRHRWDAEAGYAVQVAANKVLS